MDPLNYRPRSLLPVLSKTFEIISLDKMNDFLSHNKNVKIVKDFDDSLLTGMFLIDLQKAVDTINHDILLKN